MGVYLIPFLFSSWDAVTGIAEWSTLMNNKWCCGCFAFDYGLVEREEAYKVSWKRDSGKLPLACNPMKNNRNQNMLVLCWLVVEVWLRGLFVHSSLKAICVIKIVNVIAWTMHQTFTSWFPPRRGNLCMGTRHGPRTLVLLYSRSKRMNQNLPRGKQSGYSSTLALLGGSTWPLHCS